jgi:hypothetical protein
MRYKGGVISATPPTTSTTSASGSWTLQQQMQATAAGNWPRNGPFNYIEDVFSTYLYTGTGSPTGITVNNGIDLATKGGLLWCKNRTTGSTPHYLFDTARPFSYTSARSLNTASTAAQENQGTNFAKPETTGFSFGDGAGSTSPNKSGDAFASWTFRKQPKFFDVLTYTGTGSQQSINHNLGSVPGCIIVKRTDTTSSYWGVYHRSLTSGYAIGLNTTEAAFNAPSFFVDSASQTSTQFTVGTSANVNASGGTYVAYLFAHDAGGFGTSGNDNVISCGSFTDPASGGTTEVTLGYEPQWLLVKPNLASTDWYLIDNMRGMVRGSATRILNPNLSAAESNGFSNAYYQPTATGFTAGNTVTGGGGTQCIYIAIRRGPMKVPTTGTSVYNGITRTGTGSAATVTNIGFPPDMVLSERRLGPEGFMANRLAGFSNTAAQYLFTPYTSAEFAATTSTSGIMLDGTTTGTASLTSGSSNLNINGNAYIDYFMRRAPGFMDVCCYTGTGSARTVAHNLAAVPELMIVKRRDATAGWPVYSAAVGATKYLLLNSDGGAATSSAFWNDTSPTSSVFTVGTQSNVNASGGTYVAYLFASAPGVSKVGSYTGTGTTQTINCGFTGGARFILIVRTDTNGDWYVWDSARGIVAGNDPYLLLNSTAAEVTSTDYIDTAATGFEISSTAPAAINANGGSFIFLAIA